MACAVELELVPFTGYTAKCRCGYVCSFGVSEVVGPQHFSGPVCNEMRAMVLEVFGPGGPRTLVQKGEEAFVPATMGTREEDFRPDLDARYPGGR